MNDRTWQELRIKTHERVSSRPRVEQDEIGTHSLGVNFIHFVNFDQPVNEPTWHELKIETHERDLSRPGLEQEGSGKQHRETVGRSPGGTWPQSTLVEEGA